jgi:hypothetical protein
VSEAKASIDTRKIGYQNVSTTLVLIVGVRIFSMERTLTKNLTRLPEKEVKQIK